MIACAVSYLHAIESIRGIAAILQGRNEDSSINHRERNKLAEKELVEYADFYLVVRVNCLARL